MDDILFKKIIAHSKEYGFVFPSSDIYDGLTAVYDYGALGSALKNNLKEYWWRSMVYLHDNIVGIDAAIFMNPKTWQASGHIDAFNDPLIDNKDSKKRYRADVLIEDALAKIQNKIQKYIDKAHKKYGDTFDREHFCKTNPQIQPLQEKYIALQDIFTKALQDNDLEKLRTIIETENIVCPISNTSNWTDVRQFNLMFHTQMGVTGDKTGLLYLRPETAQGIFINFLQIQKNTRQKIPFGIAQIGKAFRNEIVARQFIFRMKEFEQMEMQFFVSPGTEDVWYEYWKQKRWNWHQKIGLGEDFYRFQNHRNVAHYAKEACDIEFNFPFGFKELEGIHSRTDFDLKNHQELSGKKQQYFDPQTKMSYIPYVIETSIGVDRLFLALMTASLKEEILEDNTSRLVLKIPPPLAPYKVAFLPLLKQDNLIAIALDLQKTCALAMHTTYDAKDSIGRRYRRQDAMGTPFCVTIDYESILDNAVTIRFRDTCIQERIPISQVLDYIKTKVCMTNLLKFL